jgi:hypothetical protein
MSWSDAEFPLLGLPGETLKHKGKRPVAWTYDCYPVPGWRARVEPSVASQGLSLFVCVCQEHQDPDDGAGRINRFIDSPLQALAFIHDCVQRMSNPGGNNEVVTARGGRGTAS